MRKYFYFNQREKEGIIVLIILICSIFSLSFFINEREVTPLSMEEKEKIIKWVDSLYTKPKAILDKASNEKRIQKRVKKLNIELNTTDSSALVKIRGIGPSFSRRIIKYRTLLGGYYKKEQLLEVYGLDSAKYKQIREHFIECDTSLLVKININSASFKELLKHPYISYDFVKRIVNARRKEKYKSVTGLKERGIIPDSLYQKIRPYIKVKE